ncbi:Uncharacterised protein [Serratia ficaria]|nr:Uncharacterised protein [Serratia ficaria]
MFAGERIGQTVAQHAVHQCAVAHTLSPAGRGGEIHGVAHAFRPAGDHDLRVSHRDGLGAENYRFQSRAADLADGKGAFFNRNSGGNRHLAGNVLAQSGAQDISHNDFIDVLRFNCGAGNGRGGRIFPQLYGRKIFQRAAKTADRRTGGADNHHIFYTHVITPLVAGRYIWQSGYPGIPLFSGMKAFSAHGLLSATAFCGSGYLALCVINYHRAGVKKRMPCVFKFLYI